MSRFLKSVKECVWTSLCLCCMRWWVCNGLCTHFTGCWYLVRGKPIEEDISHRNPQVRKQFADYKTGMECKKKTGTSQRQECNILRNRMTCTLQCHVGEPQVMIKAQMSFHRTCNEAPHVNRTNYRKTVRQTQHGIKVRRDPGCKEEDEEERSTLLTSPSPSTAPISQSNPGWLTDWWMPHDSLCTTEPTCLSFNELLANH